MGGRRKGFRKKKEKETAVGGGGVRGKGEGEHQSFLSPYIHVSIYEMLLISFAVEIKMWSDIKRKLSHGVKKGKVLQIFP